MATRRSRRGSKKSGFRFAQRAWAPFGHLLGASGNTLKELGSTAGNVTKRTLNGVGRVGHIWTSHTNQAISNVLKKRRATRRRR